jgi:translation elongation factor EF-4
LNAEKEGIIEMATKRNLQAWAEAKKRCRLNVTDIQMAKELGMTPKSLIKNIPAPNEQWKAPVKVWIRDLYEEKFGRVLTVNPVLSGEIKRKAIKREKAIVSEYWDDEEDLPF